ncbi:methylmalonyl-CoA mutase family protein [Bacillus marasmi]|uniref:methylmalonyl-CoA mutase family protein n=1 Tax=Bacillus marasmi TaxID=1926279 RepID=UPI001FE55BCD|nr:methylmalonyl-CoA mutase family protein [Bacillus marasmi]
MKSVVFPPVSTDEWKQKAEESLKGKSVDSLSRSTYEDIRLKPLYTKEDLENKVVSEIPGFEDYRRGINPLGYATNEWKVAQTIPAGNVDEMKEMLITSFQKGQTAISFELSEKVLLEIPNILTDVFASYPFSVNAKHYQADLLTLVQQLAEEKGKIEDVCGFIGLDPIAVAVETGADIDTAYDQWAKTISYNAEKLPNLKTILVDTTPYHNGGANAVQELAISLATGVEHIEKLSERGLSIEHILEKMVFKFAIGSNFFMEMAKLRAARLLWSKLTEAYAVAPELRKLVISAETSPYTKTKYDPYVNLLRAGNEAFAAILGGIQYLHVSPFNEPEGKVNGFSDRIARNIQLVLKEEAHLKNVVDPAGGSWYIESLTNELAEKAWALFLEIDEKGGLVSALRSNWLQEQIQAVKEKRQKDIFTRKQSIIGTNIYANLAEEPLQVQEANAAKQDGSFQTIAQERLAQPYEVLRSRAEKLVAEPTIGLICLGELKNHKARADFITGFVAPGGIKTVKSDAVDSIESAVAFVSGTPVSHYCICGSNDQYNEFGAELVAKLKEQNPAATFYIAGALENETEWKTAGIRDFITVKSNCYQTLAQLLDEMEV